MAIANVTDYITKALQKIGVVAQGESATTAQASDALDAFNALASSLSADNLLTVAQIQDSFSLVAGTAEYTIGANQTFDTTKPLSVKNAYVKDSVNTDHPLSIVPRNIYDAQADKTSQGIPRILFYDKGTTQNANNTGTIKLNPVPNANDTLVMISEKPFTRAANAAEAITFPGEYDRMFIFNLAIDLAPDYGITPTQEVKDIAKESKEIIENLNAQNKSVDAILHLPGSGRLHSSDYRSG